jgi:diadenosine tetraphosphate (Ap4A) HIT family hydrolase
MSRDQQACPFCDRIARGEVDIADDPLMVALRDAFPVSPGHSLVVPRRHVASWLDLTAAEAAHAWTLVARTTRSLDLAHHPDGYNLGVNVGAAAGQTVAHAHLHLIPRYAGDAPDPRGGVRWILPAQARYWDRTP